jgi:hypothetical protein
MPSPDASACQSHDKRRVSRTLENGSTAYRDFFNGEIADVTLSS